MKKQKKVYVSLIEKGAQIVGVGTDKNEICIRKKLVNGYKKIFFFDSFFVTFYTNTSQRSVCEQRKWGARLNGAHYSQLLTQKHRANKRRGT